MSWALLNRPVSTLPFLSEAEFELLDRAVFNNPWIPKKKSPRTGRFGPSIKQSLFLCRSERERLFGGATGGGKSWGLLAAAAMFVDLPGYSCIIFRRALTDHSLEGGLIPKSQEWWLDKKIPGVGEARWNGVKVRWEFPSKAVIQFGFLACEGDLQRYDSTEWQRICWDELVQFPEYYYSFMMSRLRKDAGSPIPLSVLSGTNPAKTSADVGHEWIKDRFIKNVDGAADRLFIPALLEDNDFIDQEEYERSLANLDHVTFQKLRYGDWDISATGNKFKYAWFINDNELSGPRRNQIVDRVPVLDSEVRFWDLAATEPRKRSDDPDWTAGVKIGVGEHKYYVTDVQRFRGTPSTNERRVKQTAQIDGVGVTQYIEQEPGASGKSSIDHYVRDVMAGLPCLGVKSTGDKELRANPFSTACENGLVYLVKAGWNSAFINELCQFPAGSHDDQVDAASGAFSKLFTGAFGEISVSFGRRPK